MSKLYTLKLTAAQAWALYQGFDASFTDPESKNDAEKKVSEKLADLYSIVHKDKTKAAKK